VAAALFSSKGAAPGFHGHLHATCLEGTGLSSSAAFSVLAGGAFSFLYQNGTRSAQELAMAAQRAENDFFGKPCGLMDQMAVAVGGTIFIDFENPEQPSVSAVEHDLTDSGYRLVIVDTGTSHVGLTAEYAAANQEMRTAARVLGRQVARGIELKEVLAGLKEIRTKAGDRAALRLLHFVEENERVQQMATALEADRFSDFLELVEASGVSSCNLLQNCSTASSTREQGILLALALSKRVCQAVVSRVHGGGFAGTIQSWVPQDEFSNYVRSMEDVFGTGSVMGVRLGRPGVCTIGGSGLFIPEMGSG
jgi:galactokinase